MAKASQVPGLANQSDYGDEKTYAMWEIFGKQLVIKEKLFDKEGTYNGNPTLSCLVRAVVDQGQDMDEDIQDIKLWVNGKIAYTVSDFFEKHKKGTATEDVLEGTFYLNPIVNGEQFNGWCLLDNDVTVDDYTLPDKAAKALAEQHLKNKGDSKEMSFEPEPVGSKA